jgi:hypothetical protein
MTMTFPAVSRARMDAGHTVLEVIMVLGLIGLIMGALLESMIGIRQYATSAEVQDDLTVEGQRVLAIIRDDLVDSGWYLPYGSPVTTNERGDLYYPYIQEQYNSGGVSRLGTMFPQHDRLAYKAATGIDYVTLTNLTNLPGSPADANLASLTATQYQTSHYARSQEIIFLKVSTGGFSTNASTQQFQPIDFSDKNGATYTDTLKHHALGIRLWSEWGRGTSWDSTAGKWYIDGGTYGHIYDADASGIWLQPATTSGTPWAMQMPLRWEAFTKYPNLTASSTNSPPVVDLRELREYSYVVIPNTSAGGRGELVRTYKHPKNNRTDSAGNVTAGVSSGMQVIGEGDFNPPFPGFAIGSPGMGAVTSDLVVDRVISDKVDRITFDTFRSDTAGALEVNQVRVRVFLSKLPSGSLGPPTHRIVEATLGMRSTSDSGALNTLTPLLGSGGSVVLH